MTPLKFDGFNAVYRAPDYWDSEANGPCVDLPVRREGGVVTSRWQPTYDELQALYNGAAIELVVHGGQPAVDLRVV